MKSIKQILIAAQGFEKDLTAELDQWINSSEELVLCQERLFALSTELTTHPTWAQSVWSDIEIVEIKSIKDASAQLKNRKKYWQPYSYQLHRRTELIYEQLPPCRFRNAKNEFLKPIQTPDYGVFLLLSANQMLIANKVETQTPTGDILFIEDKLNPPSRAYLKLWELFTIHNIKPLPKEVCVELGAAPGGWTWVLKNMNCEIYSFDRAPLDDKIAKHTLIHHQIKDAFCVKPQDIPKKVDWFFSDLICDPNKLYSYLEQFWDFANSEVKFVCTLKFKGETDFAILNKFKQIKKSKVLHLYHNKHEVTFIKV